MREVFSSLGRGIILRVFSALFHILSNFVSQKETLYCGLQKDNGANICLGRNREGWCTLQSTLRMPINIFPVIAVNVDFIGLHFPLHSKAYTENGQRYKTSSRT